MFGRPFNAFTNLFKTYATLSPGFFVRNIIGGMFMNTSDGVSLAHQLNGAKFWHQWMKGGNDWLERQPRHIQRRLRRHLLLRCRWTVRRLRA